jgi:hypothetical protein
MTQTCSSCGFFLSSGIIFRLFSLFEFRIFGFIVFPCPLLLHLSIVSEHS